MYQTHYSACIFLADVIWKLEVQNTSIYYLHCRATLLYWSLLYEYSV